jgi:hypothetical protein
MESAGIQRMARSAMLRARRGTRSSRSDDDGTRDELVAIPLWVVEFRVSRISVSHQGTPSRHVSCDCARETWTCWLSRDLCSFVTLTLCPHPSTCTPHYKHKTSRGLRSRLPSAADTPAAADRRHRLGSSIAAACYSASCMSIVDNPASCTSIIYNPTPRKSVIDHHNFTPQTHSPSPPATQSQLSASHHSP